MYFGEKEVVIKFSIITVNYNGEKFLEETIQSVLSQASSGIDLEYLIIDGGSTDKSLEIIGKYKSPLVRVVSEPDDGPANAINKGLKLATGDVLAWLNSDDRYYPGTLERVKAVFERFPSAPFCFGKCSIINERSEEIRKGITRFKEFFFPLSSRFTYRCINYISQPAMFFRREPFQKAGYLDETMIAAWDYKFILNLWRYGKGEVLAGPPLAMFRWHEESISGRNFVLQFKEEYEAARDEAGICRVSTILHLFTRWMIVGAYSFFALYRAFQKKKISR